MSVSDVSNNLYTTWEAISLCIDKSQETQTLHRVVRLTTIRCPSFKHLKLALFNNQYLWIVNGIADGIKRERT